MKRRLTLDSIRDKEIREDAFIEGVSRYIAECGARGVNKVLAQAIANHFKSETYDVILNRPDELLSVDGIGQKRAKDLHRWFQDRFGENVSNDLRNDYIWECGLMTTLYAIRLSNWEISQVRDRYGDSHVLKVIKENPYQLTEVNGIGFKRADKIAQAIGYDLQDPRRIAAGLIYTLSQQESNGHCCMPPYDLTTEAAKELMLPESLVSPVLAEMVTSGRLEGSLERIYLPNVFDDECVVAGYLRDLAEMQQQSYLGVDDIMADVREYHAHLNEEQLSAIRSVLTNGVTVLTGGPGTGKTTTLRGMIKAVRRAGWTFSLCAPTGRAAKRMGESSGCPAQTIHRLLGYQGESFKYGIDYPLSEDIIIVDEASMIDLNLMRHLLDAMKYRSRLVLIGDADQLPSVGAGRVLGDVIDSGVIPVIRLQHIYRQTNTDTDEESSIVNNAHRIISGQMPVIMNRQSRDFFALNIESEEKAQEEIVRLVSERLPRQFPGKEIQVLAPLRQNGLTSVDALNPLLQEVVNPHGTPMKHRGIEFRTGDRVMQIKNNYDKSVYNGDVGRIADVHPEFDMLSVDYGYDNLTRYYDAPAMRDLDELQLAYATTIHKSQGSEYDIVVVVLMPSASIMLQRNLLYTAVTRAKDACVLVYHRDSLVKAIENFRIKPRWTRLKERLNYNLL